MGVEHWNAEALGWHVAKRGDRYAALQAVGMAVRNVFGHVSPGAARGVALRHDHGSAFLAEHFHNQIRFWCMTPSYAFVGEPETMWRHRAVLPHPQGADRAWPKLASVLVVEIPGGRGYAHDLVYDICREAVRQDRPLLDLLAENEEITRHLDRAQIAALCDPANYLGQSGVMVDRVLDRLSARL